MTTLAGIENLPSREAIEQEMLWRKAVSYRNDPLGFVLWAYPWGQAGPLEKYAGPDDWQSEFLDRGEDSDFFRVRVLGLPPSTDDAQFIDSERIVEAQKREVAVLENEPLVAGVDLAWGGDDWNVVRFRRGKDARSIPAIRIPGEKTRDSAVMVVKLSDLLREGVKGQKVHTMFIDSAGISGAVGSKLWDLGYKNVIEINFGADSPDPKYRNMRAYMWGKMKDWLLTGAIDDNPRLECDLGAPGYELDAKVRILLEAKDEMKMRGVDSPDDADALALTFARRIAVPVPQHARPSWPTTVWS